VCLAWLEAGGKADLPELLEKYTVPAGNLSALTVDGFIGVDDAEEAQPAMQLRQGRVWGRAQALVQAPHAASAPSLLQQFVRRVVGTPR
jgi:hypothetical protein